MQNFDYLKDIEQLHDLYIFCQAAEASVNTDKDATALNSRRALEWMVKTIYTLKNIQIPERANLYELMSGDPFVSFVNDERLMMAAHYIRKVGNLAAHDGGVTGGQAYFCVLNLYNFIGGILLKLRVLSTLAPFDRELLNNKPAVHVVPREEIPAAPVEFVASVPVEAIESPAPVPVVSTDYSEAETRKLFIDLLIQEAGWQIVDQKGIVAPGKACIEVELQGMPNEQGVGYADYVLFAPDGKPLAVVEAKRTTVDPEAGKQQAKLYADCLEAKYGVRPVIYITNGFTTQIIDGLGYPARRVFGILTQDDLQLVLQRRGRGSMQDLRIKDEITNRYYQKEAIHAVCNHFNEMHRRALLVMATGTGKTRVSISLCDVLMRNGWAKNILFLADRTALVNQAKKNFAKLLPNATVSVLNEEREPDLNARITFSTYQTMINYIDAPTKVFSVGRFDLIIIDEAHRSVFGKYTAILDYFDGLIVGLTATPREEVDRSTYELFGLEGGVPNYSYSLEQAVEDHYLVPPLWISRSTKRLKEGIKYAELTPEERKQMEAVWEYERNKGSLDADHRDVANNELFSYIFNKDTVDKVLRNLMETGYRIDAGEKLGKTIIFTANHDHAALVVERFHALYPELGEDFCALIDNQVKYAQNLIDRFASPDKLPQIAVSVDMLDTGIDVPEVLNLVFFKKVRSKIKFWQMVGRGTRLCENLLGDGLDKQNFQLIDWCGNIEYFGEESGVDPVPALPLSARLFNLRLAVACALQHATYQQEEFPKKLHDELKSILRTQVLGLKDTQIGVRQHWELIDKYRKEENWAYVSEVDRADLENCVAPLLPLQTNDTAALRFDVLMLNMQLALVDETQKAPLRSRVKVSQIANALLERASIPQVSAKIRLLQEISDPKIFEGAALDYLEKVRIEIRDLVQFILGDDHRTFTLNIEDIVEDLGPVDAPVLVVTYKQRVIDFLRENRSLPVIQKLINMEQLTHADIIQLETICWRDLGTKEEYQAYVRGCKMICGDVVAAFIRSIVGIDRDKALQQYGKFLTDTVLNPEQEEYLGTIISYVCENGDITGNTMVNERPFVDFQWQQVFGSDLMNVSRFINNLHNVIVA